MELLPDFTWFDLVVIPILYYAWELRNQVQQIKEDVKRSAEEQEREHAAVFRSVEKITKDHHEHDKQNTRIETKLDLLLKKHD
jgi:ferric iron reductase protein FhuF